MISYTKMVKSLNIAAVTSLTLVYLASAAPVEKVVEDRPTHALAEIDDNMLGENHPTFYKASPALKNSKVDVDGSDSKHTVDPEESFDEIGSLRKRNNDAADSDVILDPIYPGSKEDVSSFEKRDTEDPLDVTILDSGFSKDPVGPALPQGDIDPGFNRPSIYPPKDNQDIDPDMVRHFTGPAFQSPSQTGAPEAKPRPGKRDSPNAIELDPQTAPTQLAHGKKVDPAFNQPASVSQAENSSNVVDLDPQPIDDPDLPQGQDIDPGFSKPLKPKLMQTVQKFNLELKNGMKTIQM
jgi:hypothetical protein